MDEELSKKKQDNNFADDPLVGIVGQQGLLSELLAWFLNRETGLGCACASSFDKKTPAFSNDMSKLRLILLDCERINSANLRDRLSSVNKITPQGCMIALFNVSHDQGIEKLAAYEGVRGVFYQDDSLEALQKGVPAILKGEPWFSRETLLKGLQELRPAAELLEFTGTSLSPRESEILLLLASGLTNDEIAEELHISSHTVKNHISKIYQKIEVTNRLQAAMWAKKYLDT